VGVDSAFKWNIMPIKNNKVNKGFNLVFDIFNMYAKIWRKNK
jgi:hypothetical protein